MRLSKFYKKLFEWQNVSNSHLAGEEAMCVHTVEPYIEQPTYTETEIILDKLKNGKTPGYDQIPAELIK
jgi:hypothetical protein